MLRDHLEAMKAEFPTLSLRENVPWREVTSLKAGGDIPALAEPPDDIVLARLIRFCRKRRIPILLLGNGSNLIGSDRDSELLVIRLNRGNFIRICFADGRIIAGAGVRLKDFARACLERGFGGLAPLIGIPGRIGGMLRMNAGANGASISDHLYELCGFGPNGESWSLLKEEVAWEYRHASLPPDTVITAAIFKLPPASANEQQLIADELKKRSERQPKGFNAGCFFRNPGKESAGKLIDEAGCKGLTVGDAAVSDLHANFILNLGHATEKDISDLMILIRQRVAAYSGIYLRPEVCFASAEALENFYAAVPAPRVALTEDSPLYGVLKNIGCELVRPGEPADLIPTGVLPPETLTERACAAWLRDLVSHKK
jgi:UDP-N-acetylenolpyruvoylglucosamine reductase